MTGPNKAIFALILALSFVPPMSQAQEDSASSEMPMRDMTPEQRRAAFEAMSDEEKQDLRKKQRAYRQKMREEFDAMTPEEQQEKRKEMRARFDALSPEEQEAVRERRKRNQNGSNRSRQKPEPPKDPE